MTARRDEVGAALRARREELIESLESLQRNHDAVVAASLDSNADDEHDPEGATIAVEREQLTALHASTAAALDQVEAAVVAHDAGEYGRCVRCGVDIPVDRVLARPGTDRCVACAD